MSTSRELEQERKAIAERIRNFGVDINPGMFSTDQLYKVEGMLAKSTERLRAALEKALEHLEADRDRQGAFQSVHHKMAWEIVTKALSQSPTEPSGVEKVKMLWENCDSTEATIIETTLDSLGIKIPGINSPEGAES